METAYTTTNLWAISIAAYEKQWTENPSPDCELLKRASKFRCGTAGRADVRAILTGYSVQGVSNAETDKFAELLCKLPIPKNVLVERATHARKLAQEVKDARDCKKLHLSGASKLLWFMYPEGWTMYDKLASTGLLHASARKRGEHRFEQFYRLLAEKEFPGFCEGIRCLLPDNDFFQYPERIVDKALMHLASPDCYKKLTLAGETGHLDTAAKIAFKTDNHLLVQHLKKTWALVGPTKAA